MGGIGKILITGASYSRGGGLPGGIDNPEIWPNRLSRMFGQTELINRAVNGINNNDIFLESAYQLATNKFDLAIVSWANIPVYSYHVGLELYNVHTNLGNTMDHHVFGNKTIKKKWLADIGDKLRLIHSDHWDLLALVKYTTILSTLSDNVYFINMNMDFLPPQYFTKKKIKLPSDLDSYTQSILNVDFRDDSDIFKLYDMIHDQYKEYGGIHEDRWLNLYEAMDTMKIDVASDIDPHPGLKSQEVFANIIYDRLMQKMANNHCNGGVENNNNIMNETSENTN